MPGLHMRPPDLLKGIGRPVAYYPRLRDIAGSTQAALLLSQLIYWLGKEAGADGWLLKRGRLDPEDPAGTIDPSHQSIEFETGLTYKQQKVARRQLRTRGLLHEKRRRIENELFFRVDTEQLKSA
jgi:hypothetical protein